MKKIITFSLVLLFVLTSVFAEKYRYLIVQQTSRSGGILMIAQYDKEIPVEILENHDFLMFESLNTNKDRIRVEAGLRNVESFYYSGSLQCIFVDYSKNVEDPDMEYIRSWSEVLEYVRGDK